jgi:replication-associated recombination protein RarA
MLAFLLINEGDVDVKKFLKEEDLSSQNLWSLEVPDKGVKIAELREWLKKYYLGGKLGELMVFHISNLDKLNEQCQNLLLKPLEESRDEVLFVLTAENKASVLETILSRCRVRKLSKGGQDFIKGDLKNKGLGGNRKDRLEKRNNEAWHDLVESWRLGAGASLSLLDRWEKDSELELLDFFIKKLAKATRSVPSKRRVKILNLGLELKKDAGLMVNRKLLLGRFLLEGGQLSGLDSSA